MDQINTNWDDFLNTEKVRNELDYIEKNLVKEDYFPAKKNVLRFLSQDPVTIQYIIVGMEPYPADYEKDGVLHPIATGRSFEVDNITDWNQKFKQSSLRNILKAVFYECTGAEKSMGQIRTEILDGTFPISQPKEWFNKMEGQGVLFLNASLSVRKYEVGSHADIWDEFMNQLILFLKEKNNPKWLLFGKDAQRRVLPHISEESAICVCHPRLYGFVKERPFKSMKNTIKLNC